MTPSEELELKIFRFAESAAKGGWRRTHLLALSTVVKCFDQAVLIEALDDLNARRRMKFRQWSDQQKDWILYRGKNAQCLQRSMFEMHVTFSGRQYFERLEAESKEPGRPTQAHKPVLETAERKATSQASMEVPRALGLLPIPDGPLAGVSDRRSSQRHQQTTPTSSRSLFLTCRTLRIA